MQNVKTAVVIPAYKVPDCIKDVILTIPDGISHIIVIDDCCPFSSGRNAEMTGRANVTVLYHSKNQGVGGAVVTGYKKALELGCEVIVKMDGDGQMDPAYIDSLIVPLISNEADYTKGNRFTNLSALKSMPKIRLLGNSGLSFLVKAASGYWNIMDPTNGYTAIHKRILEKLNLDRIAKRFFFESDMLINLNIVNAVVADIEMPAKYDEFGKSSLNIKKTLLHFPPKLVRGLFRRLFLKYFIYDFNMASVYIVIGFPMFIASIFFGIYEWINSIITGITKSAGTIMLVALPIIISFQMLLHAIQIDIQSVPRKTGKNNKCI